MSEIINKQFDGELNTSEITDLMFDTKYITYKHHHDSFNQFITDCVLEEMSLPVLISENENNGKVYKHYMNYHQVRLKEASDETSDDINTILFPEDFKRQLLTYSSRLIADLEQTLVIYTPETETTETRVVHSDKNVTVGKIPIMTRSSACNTNLYKDRENIECPYNAGGFFILKGAEKVVIPQENIAHNRCYVFPKKDKAADKNGYTAQVYSKNVEKVNSNLQIVSVNFRKNELTLTMSQLSNIPICILFKAMGIVTDRDIVDHIIVSPSDIDMTNLIRPSITRYKSETWKFDSIDDKEMPKPVISQDDAINYLIGKISTSGKRFSATDADMLYRQKREYLHKTILERDFIPHMSGNDYNKACYIGAMCTKLLNYYLGRIQPDERDSLCNKRIENTGILMGQNFRQAKKKLDGDQTKHFRKKNTSDEAPMDMTSQIKHTIIEQNMTTPLSNGTWIVSGKKGVAQMMNRFTYTQYSSIMHRVATTQVTNTTKATGMRFVHNSQYGFYDPAETPEHGHNVGTIKHLAMTATITINAPSQPDIIKKLLYNEIHDLGDVPITSFNKFTKVNLNGQWLGLTDEPNVLTNWLKQKRISGEIEKQVSIAYNMNKKEININTDAGRLLRPLLRVKDNELHLTKEMLLDIDFKRLDKPEQVHTWLEFLMKYPETIDFVDPEEQETLMIAHWQNDLNDSKKKMNTVVKNPEQMGSLDNRYDENIYKRYTHCEIHPSTLIGHILANAKFIEHNMGPRNYFAFAQHKQGMGKYLSNYRHRTDLGYNLYDPEKPLVYAKTAEYTHVLDLPYFQNPTVAILQYTGYNQEDSILMNAGSIARGMFRAESFRKESLSITKNTTALDDTFKKPDKNRTTGMKDANYEKLNTEGYVPVETKIVPNDVIFGKTGPLPRIDEKNPEITEKDSSLIYKSGVNGVIDHVTTEFKNNDGFPTYSARIRQKRIPIGGDKFCCYTSDHDVMTSDGWKPINEITMKDRVACVKRVGEEGGEKKDLLLYKNPIAVQEYDYDGKLYSVKTNQIDLVVTPNHRMYVGNRDGTKYHIEKAENIYGKRLCYKKNIDAFYPEPDTYRNTFTLPGLFESGMTEHPDLKIPMDEWLMFFGIWIAEGCTSFRNQTVISAHKPRVKEALDRINKRLKFDVVKMLNKRSMIEDYWCFKGNQLTRYLEPLSVGAVNKSLPDWVWNLTMDQCRTLMDGMLLGDGHRMDNGTRRYDTSSTKLADDFQRLCLHAGWSSNKTVKYEAGHKATIKTGDRAGYVIKSNTDAYRLTVITAQNKPLANKNKKADGTGQLDKYIDFNDTNVENCIPNKVYCCSVPYEGLIYIRRNGVVTLGGNSSHGQKGTIGYIVPEEDMPFTEEGIRPDIIINSCCIPTRMTIGQLLETLLNNYAAIIGKPLVIKQFEHIDVAPAVKAIADFKKMVVDCDLENMDAHDFFKYSSETMYCGFDGKRMELPVFIGITTYLRLKHLVDDKVHARARGPMTALLRQPPEGRARDGGLRLGEMERDVFIAHGIPYTIKNKFMEDSDGYIMRVCTSCGLIAQKKMNKNIWICASCNALPPEQRPLQKPFCQKVYLPYAFKIFVQEMASIGILMRIRIDNDEYSNAI